MVGNLEHAAARSANGSVVKVSSGADGERAESIAPARAALGGKYRLLRSLGRGASGEVYEAEHVDLGRRYAIKVLHRSLESQRSMQRFAREARVLARLEHENIVGLIDVGADADVGDYLVLELLRGSTLRQALPSLRLEDPERTLAVAMQIARGLGYAHSMGVVHRDLKPENVMLTSHADGRPLVKVLDFGIARLFEAERDFVTLSGATLGTAAYMAPEQARGDRDLDHRVDVYALGVIVYEALSGVRPFEGASYNETLFHVLTRKHLPLAERRPELPSGVCDAVERALQKDRADRFATVQAFAAALCGADERSARPALETLATLDLESEERTISRLSSSPGSRPAATLKGQLRGSPRSLVYGLLVGASGFALGWLFRGDDASTSGPAESASTAEPAAREGPASPETDGPLEPPAVGSARPALEPRPGAAPDRAIAPPPTRAISGVTSALPRRASPVVAPSIGSSGGVPKDRGF
jgi:eukaryotic-like serine/threonine-protein kinase